MRRYEGMFLFDSAATRDWQAIEDEVRRLLGRIDAELLVCVKFDERRLAYEIERRKRGIYVLTYFETDPERIRDLERDCQLSELVLRALFLKAENLTEERLAELKAHPAETPLSPLGDGRRHDDGPGGGRPRDRDRDRDRRPDRDRRDADERREPVTAPAGDSGSDTASGSGANDSPSSESPTDSSSEK